MSEVQQPETTADRTCFYIRGLDGWTSCAVHGWEGYKEDRKRVGTRLVCPNSPRFPRK